MARTCWLGIVVRNNLHHALAYPLPFIFSVNKALATTQSAHASGHSFHLHHLVRFAMGQQARATDPVP
eukprot:451471-Hanusia_phi.AAC.1